MYLLKIFITEVQSPQFSPSRFSCNHIKNFNIIPAHKNKRDSLNSVNLFYNGSEKYRLYDSSVDRKIFGAFLSPLFSSFKITNRLLQVEFLPLGRIIEVSFFFRNDKNWRKKTWKIGQAKINSIEICFVPCLMFEHFCLTLF